MPNLLPPRYDVLVQIMFFKSYFGGISQCPNSSGLRLVVGSALLAIGMNLINHVAQLVSFACQLIGQVVVKSQQDPFLNLDRITQGL